MPSWLWVQEIVLPILGMGMGAFFLYGTYVTVNKWLDRRHERELAEGGQQPRQLEAVVARLQETEDRVEELEERLDFAERLLAQQRDRDRLAPGSGG